MPVDKPKLEASVAAVVPKMTPRQITDAEAVEDAEAAAWKNIEILEQMGAVEEINEVAHFATQAAESLSRKGRGS